MLLVPMNTGPHRDAAELLDAYAEGARDFAAWRVRGGVLVKQRFEGCRFDGAEFSGIAGIWPTFDNCTLDQAAFTDSVLHGAAFVSSSLRGCRFTSCALQRTDFFRSGLAGALLERCIVSHACFLHTDLSDCRLDETRLEGSLFGRTAFTADTLMGADFADSVVALPHRIAAGELAKLNSMAYAARMMSNSPSAPQAGVAGWLATGLPRVVDFLERGGVGADRLVPLRNAIALAPPAVSGQVFLSYASEDQATAEQMAAMLQAAGMDVWFAPRSMRGGRKLREQLEREVDSRDRVVFLASPASMASPWVQLELRRALAAAPLARRVLPVVLAAPEAWRAWSLFDADSGRDLAAELRAGRCYAMHDVAEREDGGVATLRELIEELAPGRLAPAPSP